MNKMLELARHCDGPFRPVVLGRHNGPAQQVGQIFFFILGQPARLAQFFFVFFMGQTQFSWNGPARELARHRTGHVWAGSSPSYDELGRAMGWAGLCNVGLKWDPD